jgi:hypothetical protein
MLFVMAFMVILFLFMSKIKRNIQEEKKMRRFRNNTNETKDVLQYQPNVDWSNPDVSYTLLVD